jgi:hypothetical protein
LVTLLLFMVGDANRRGYRHLLDAFWDECASHGIPLPSEEPVSGSAFCQARYKLSNEMLRELLRNAAATFEATYPEQSRWRGRRVFAIDGSKFNLGRSEELDDHFGRPEGAYCPQAAVTALVNVASGLPCDVCIRRYASSEREMLMDHLDVFREGDLVVLDSGYPSHEVMRTLLAKGIDFLIRASESQPFPAIVWLREQRHGDYRVMMEPPARAPADAEDIEVRVLRNASSSFDLAGDPPTVTVMAGYSKRKREDRLILREETAAVLQPIIEGLEPTEPVFRMPPADRVAASLVRPDLAAAREEWLDEAEDEEELDERGRSDFLCYKDHTGRFADFHALRHSFITQVIRTGANFKTAQDLARHSTPLLTARYSHGFREDELAAVNSLPSLAPFRAQPDSALYSASKGAGRGTAVQSGAVNRGRSEGAQKGRSRKRSAITADARSGNDGVPGRARTCDLRFRKT